MGRDDGGLGGDEMTVLAGDGEPKGGLHIDRVQAASHLFEGEDDLVSVLAHFLEAGASGHNVLVIEVGQGEAGQAFGDILLVFRMNVVGLSQVGDDRLSRVYQPVEGDGLGFAQFGPFAGIGAGRLVAVVGQLNPVKGKSPCFQSSRQFWIISGNKWRY